MTSLSGKDSERLKHYSMLINTRVSTKGIIEDIKRTHMQHLKRLAVFTD